jgi:uncharacterized repeat protein (TIGR02543 family)
VTVLGNTGNLVKAGYTFVGWNTEADGSGSSYTWGTSVTMKTSDITLYAVWTAEPTYTVTYDHNGATEGSVPSGASSYAEGATVTVLGNNGNLGKTDSLFDGWNTNTDGSGEAYGAGENFTMGTENVTLYAMWAPTFTVTYDPNGADNGSVPVDDQRYAEGAAVTLASNTGGLVKTGYTFNGWNTGVDGNGAQYTQGGSFTMGVQDTVLYAQWEQIPAYIVTYNANGAESGEVPSDTEQYYEGDSVRVLGNSGSLEKYCFDFDGWNTKSDGSGPTYTFGAKFPMGDADVTLYALWTEQSKQSVTYDANGASGGSVPVDGNEYCDGDVVTVLDNTGNLVKTNYAFVGWNTNADGSGTSRTEGNTFLIGNNDITLYAEWDTTYTVTYDGNGATSGSVPVDESKYRSADLITVLDNSGSLEKPDGVFKNWNTKADGSGTDYSSGATFAMGESDIMLYAIWEPAYTVTYDGNGATGGTVPVDNYLYLEGDEVIVLDNTGNLEYGLNIFSRWNTESDMSGADYLPNQTFSIGKDDVILYAKWITSYPDNMQFIDAENESFVMGSDETSDNAKPAHTVTFTYSYWIDTTEITQANYDSIMSDVYSEYTTPSWSDAGGGDNYPVYNITWYDVVLYCNARSNIEFRDTVYSYTSISGTPGNGCELTDVIIDYDKTSCYRLPTEAEWEYACRGGTTTLYHWGDNPDNADNYAWYKDITSSAQPVAQKLPNQYGLYDMAGNVSEFCNDWYDTSYSSSDPVTDPTGPSSSLGKGIVFRNGSWNNYVSTLRSSKRSNYLRDYISENIGFRCVFRKP